jgi:hypothetical protein
VIHLKSERATKTKSSINPNLKLVKVSIEGRNRKPLKVLVRKSDEYGRFTLSKNDPEVTNRRLLIVVLEPKDPDDRIFMEEL